MTRVFRSFLLALFIALPFTVQAESKFQLTWLGHAAFKITTPSGGTLLIDPWLLNPHNPNAVEDLRKLSKVDYVLISHGHANAIGDAEEIIKKTGARLVVAARLERGLIYNKKFDKSNFLKRPLQPWSSIDLLDGEVRITVVPTEHLASTEHKDDMKMRNNTAYAGAYGFIIEIVDGPTIYHTGDTKFAAETFEAVGQRKHIDLMLTTLDAKFTLDAAEAAEAVSMVRPKMAIPMRYENAPGAVAEFQRELKSMDNKTILQEMKPGENLRY